jgi:phosphoglycerate dehydrogenase-like enzyme
MTKILIHGAVDQPGLTQLTDLTSEPFLVLEANMEEKDWVVPDEAVGQVTVMLSTHSPRNLAAMSKLAFWQIGSVGFTQLVGLGLPQRGVRVSNARGVFDVPIGEWNVAMMINLARNLRGMIRNQEQGIWDAGAQFQQEINGAVVGIWGYGGIGRETARLCRALGMRVHVLSRQGVTARENVYCLPGTGDPDGRYPHRVFLYHERFDFLQGLDFLIIAIPLTDSTRGLIGAAELAAVPRHAFVLNPARGPIIQEEALLAALREGQIAGAALDTHYYYPMPPEHPLWYLSNVIMTPHISGSSLNDRFNGRIWAIFVENARRYLAGEPLLNELIAPELNGET